MPVRGGMNVSQQQADIIDSLKTKQVTVVSAGAGTGKTHTTVAAVLELLETQRPNLGLDQFVLITFTNKAADELRKRLEQGLRKRMDAAATPADRRFWLEQRERLASTFVGTIHGFCSRMLKLFGYEERVAREVDVTLSSSPLRQAVEEAVQAAYQANTPLLGTTVEWTEYQLRDLVREMLEHIHNGGKTAAEVLIATQAQPADSGKPYRMLMAELLANAEGLYEQAKEKEHIIDSNDLLKRTASMMRSASGKAIVDKIISRYRYIFVDEFQDTDPVQTEILDALIAGKATALVVGDAKQSIFGFRGAVDTLLKAMGAKYGVPVMPLTVARRPTKPVLDVQNALFGNMGVYDLNDPLQPDPAIATPATDPVPFAYTAAQAASGSKVTLEDRIQVTAAWINELLNRKIYDTKENKVRPVEPGDIAVLLRSNRHLREYATRLRTLTGKKVQEETGGLFFQRPEIVASYRMLLLILHYPDDAVLALALDTPYFIDVDSSAKQQEIIQYQFTGTPLSDWLESNYPKHHERIEELRRDMLDDNVTQLLARIYERFGIREYYQQMKDRQSVENLEKLRELSRRLFSNEQALTLSQFVSYMEIAALTSREEREALVEVGEEEQRPDHIRVMTIHRSKGLEFPVVLIPEMQSRLIKDPPEYLIDNAGLEVKIPLTNGVETLSPDFGTKLQNQQVAQLKEEMRIFYVAVTRAKNSIVTIGSGSKQPKQRWEEFFAWKDEVLAVKTPLKQLGAQI